MESLLVPLNNCFNYKNVFQNDVNALSKMVLKTQDFCQKARNSLSLNRWYDFVQISQACDTSIFKEMYGETLDFQSQH